MKKNMRTLAETKVNLDTTLKDKEVWRDTDIAELVKKEKHNSCYCCASPNCLIKQRICIKLGVPKQYVNGCKGKYAKFGDLSSYGLPFALKKRNDKKEKNKKPEASEAAATVEKPTADIDSEGEEIENSMQDFLIQKKLPMMSASITHMDSWHTL